MLCERRVLEASAGLGFSVIAAGGCVLDGTGAPKREPVGGPPNREGALGVGAWKRLGAGVVVGTGEMPDSGVGVTPPKRDGADEPLLLAPNRLPEGLPLKREPASGFLGIYWAGVSFT
jgi:hypothetical protein